MKKTISIILYIIFILNFSLCTPKGFEIKSVRIGSNLDGQGEISDTSLVYKFKKENKGKKAMDLFNFIYFEGDTLCFSFELNKQINYNSVNVWYLDPITGKSFPAERVDLNHKRISGFSLVGSLLEKFYEKDLNKELMDENYFNRDIDFIIKLSIEYNDKKYPKEMKGSFRLEYR